MTDKHISDKQFESLMADVMAMEDEDAREAGAIGYMARVLTQATLPHSKQAGNEFTRVNGKLSVTILTPSEYGLPYGTVPRLLMTWITTEAVLKKSSHLELGPSLSAFMGELGLMPTGGRWGSIPRLRAQMNSLFSSFITCRYTDDTDPQNYDGIRNILMVENADLWWNPKKPDQATLWQSSLDLSNSFYDDVVQNPVPIDLRAIKALKRSPMALDIYIWLTYRMSYLKASRVIPWPLLQMQFGADYADTRQGRNNFKTSFLKHLAKVLLVYPEARVEDHSKSKGLLLKPSPTHIPKLPKKL